MIDRKTVLLCAVMIALMFAAGVILVWDGRTIRAVNGGAPLPALLPFFLPACGALVTASLHWTSRSAGADDAKKAPWYRWGRPVSISYWACSCCREWSSRQLSTFMCRRRSPAR